MEHKNKITTKDENVRRLRLFVYSLIGSFLETIWAVGVSFTATMVPLPLLSKGRIARPFTS